ncbi:MAG: putative lipid II flippase FtsW [Deltaproteobacteria bacterium]|jgi:cell division protein FtsW|nr:putative lipid II flippase FtsW [Deltaproteobacteria bacterium]
MKSGYKGLSDPRDKFQPFPWGGSIQAGVEKAQNTGSASPDWWLLGSALILLALGLTMVLSSSGIAAMRFHQDSYYFFKRQLLYAGIGLACLYAAQAIPLSWIEKWQYLFLVGSLILLVLCLTSHGVSVHRARRWLNLGFTRIQPMEFAKIALVLYLAYFMSSKQHIIKTFSRGIIPPFLFTGTFCLLLLRQPDFGGAAVLAMLLFFMCLIGGTRLLYLILSAVLAGVIGVFLILKEPYRLQRLVSFMDPFADARGDGYQLVQSLYAIGSGGIDGVGLGAGRQKLFYLPEAHTDFILSVLAEELGLMGITLVFILAVFIFWRGLRIALEQENLRGRLTAFGLTLVLCLPMLMNLAVVSGSIPSKGVAMPLVSYGGSSLVSSLICIGLLLNYSRYRHKGRAVHAE